jgi:hypothetical protein
MKNYDWEYCHIPLIYKATGNYKISHLTSQSYSVELYVCFQLPIYNLNKGKGEIYIYIYIHMLNEYVYMYIYT